MKNKIIISVLIAMYSLLAFSQKNNNMRDSLSYEHTNLYAYLIELEQISGKDNIKHIDSLSGFSITIPLWWKIRETPNISMFGGTFPEINGIQNALLFKAFDKQAYKSIKEFEDWVIAGYEIGDVPKWSDSHTFLLKKRIKNFSTLGNTYKVQLMRHNRIYVSCYIILETSNSFLWIDFTATKETYDINFPKLKLLLDSYKTL